MLKYILAAIFMFLMCFGLGLLALAQVPDNIVYQEYPTGKCLAVDVLQDDGYHRIKCEEFDFTQDYVTQWGGNPDF